MLSRVDTLPLVATALGIVAALWAGATWLFWPRVRLTIDTRIDEKTRPMTAAIARHEEQLIILPHTLRSIDHGIDRLSTAVEHLTETAAHQGQVQSEMRGEMNAHFERRRESRRAEDRGETTGEYRGPDRRRHP